MLNRKSLHYHHSPQAKRFTSAEWLQCLRSISQSQVLRQIQHPLMTMTLAEETQPLLLQLCLLLHVRRRSQWVPGGDSKQFLVLMFFGICNRSSVIAEYPLTVTVDGLADGFQLYRVAERILNAVTDLQDAKKSPSNHGYNWCREPAEAADKGKRQC